jgi:peptidoglycan/LPS O-acetylase OafA/YrhL
MILADVYVSSGGADDRRSWKADVVCVAASLAVVVCVTADILFLQRWRWMFTPPLVLVAYAAAYRSVGVRGVLTNRWICVIGGMCYTTYLYHFHVMRALDGPAHSLDGHGPLVDFLLEAAVMIPAVLVVSAVLFVLFEKPFMYRDWPAKFMARLRPRSS